MTVHKTFEIKVLDKRENGGRIRINTGSVDRDNDRVFPVGARIDSYLKNPVVQWGHNYTDPWAVAGRTNELIVTPDYIDADFDLRPAANVADPQNIVLLLWNGEWVKSASIGFLPNPKTAKRNEVGGYDYDDWELLEWSIVTIGSQRDALRLAMKALENTEPVTKDFTSFIEQKRGRVISAKNEQMIRAAAENLQKVLASLGEEPEEEPMEDDPMMEATEPTQQKQTDISSDAPLTQTDNPAEPPIPEPAPLVDDLTTHDESEAALEAFAKALINLTENWSK